MKTPILILGLLFVLSQQNAFAYGNDASMVLNAANQVSRDAQSMIQQFNSYQNPSSSGVLGRASGMQLYLSLVQIETTANEIATLAQSDIQQSNNYNFIRSDFITASSVLAQLYQNTKSLSNSSGINWGVWNYGYDQDLSSLQQASSAYNNQRPPQPPPRPPQPPQPPPQPPRPPQPPPPPPNRLIVSGINVDACLDLVINSKGAAYLATGSTLNDGGCASTPSDQSYAAAKLYDQASGNVPFNPNINAAINVTSGRVSAQRLGVFNYADGPALVIRLTDSAGGAATGVTVELDY